MSAVHAELNVPLGFGLLPALVPLILGGQDTPRPPRRAAKPSVFVPSQQ